ncbi:hypothetical protein KDN34_13760 [Shewanella yunxiaonensis]|uniref:OmpA-like domain-containing protein n=1 Tax=Shewanella yunxiaonensis TaxID=2829809 RepID=A0ABX7YR95_9GAMM|nr:hypothetical protein [Shewanella yunxiaonensis]QUN05252.1 hypothetical protein KDN34_13760 [Shewanella yunxiaonensis]
MRSWVLSTVIGCFVSGSVMASCNDEQKLGQVTYANNSSFFSAKDSKGLDHIKKIVSNKQDGYLLLEFNLFPSPGDKKQQQYNLWLANRRIDRVKSYLSVANLPLPIITRIRTAAPEEQRNVDILWCPTSTMADNSNAKKQ